MSSTIRIMRLSILAALGLSSASAFAQDGEALGFIPSCENPRPLPSELVGDSGFVRCPDGRMLRERAIWDLPGNSTEACQAEFVDPGFSECLEDAQCTARPYGSCNMDYENSRGERCGCEYRCMSDLDCRIGQVCAARQATSIGQKRCVAASNCRTNADCASGQCEVSYDHSRSFGGSTTLACRTERDECINHEDCPNSPCHACAFDPGAGYWRCAEECFQLGRPFLVQGEAVLPALVPGAAWIDASSWPASSLDGEMAKQAAAHWIECARMEHASVAAFARFALQLMHLGAPPQLLQSTTQAMQDEIAHAKACFALAERYSGQAQSAGELEVSQALEQELEPARIAVDVFLEGCVGESVAALEASEMSRLCADSKVKAVLQKVADDEHQHALLAWRSLGWMLDSLRGSARDEVLDAIGRQVAQLRQELAEPAPGLALVPQALEAHGVPSSQRKTALRRQALAQLVVPCASGLLAQHCRSQSSRASQLPSHDGSEQLYSA